MNRLTLAAILLTSAAMPVFCQAPEEKPMFEAADIHASPKTLNPFFRPMLPHGGRYEIKFATMVDLVRTAYGFDPDKVLGGPNWVEMDRFDIIAKLPAESTPESQKLMLQALLADRFKLKTHTENKPLPTYALVVGKKLQLKEGDGSGETGCHPESGSPGGGRGNVVMMMSTVMNGVSSTISLGPDMMIEYHCRNMSMAAFTSNLRGMMGVSLGTNPVIDDTSLKGMWNFDLRFSFNMNGGPILPNGTAERLTIQEAVEKQLGLKLEERQVPTPVIFIDSVAHKPTDNSPDLAMLLPPIPVPTEFDVASVKPSDTSAANRVRRFGTQPGGKLDIQGMPMRTILSRAFNTNNQDQIVGAPKWADSDQFDIVAKAPSAGPAAPAMDMEAMAPLIRALLADRFKMTYHTEERPMNAYSLVSAKPKMKKADPESRSWCKNQPAPPSAPQGSRVFACQNVTMTQFAERLQNMTPELNWPVLDATGIEGGWDFSITFSVRFAFAPGAAAAVRLGDGGGGVAGGLGAAAGDGNSASDPTGGMTLFEAIEKQLGLKLEMQKRPVTVYVIDHMEQKPTEN
jgi:uncharacterized protein (TIGR03435 family)